MKDDGYVVKDVVTATAKGIVDKDGNVLSVEEVLCRVLNKIDAVHAGIVGK